VLTQIDVDSRESKPTSKAAGIAPAAIFPGGIRLAAMIGVSNSLNQVVGPVDSLYVFVDKSIISCFSFEVIAGNLKLPPHTLLCVLQI